MLSSIDISRSAFEYQEIQLFTDEPDHDGIRTSNDKLKSNTVSITSTLSGVNHGIFGLIMVYASCFVVSSHTSRFPANPSLLYINLISRSLTKIYHEVKRTDRDLKQLVTETFDDDYTNDLHDRNIGFVSVATMESITHLYDYFVANLV